MPKQAEQAGQPDVIPFRFMNLPPSIRLQIYRILLDCSTKKFINMNHVPKSQIRTVNWIRNNPSQLSPPEDPEEVEAGTVKDFAPSKPRLEAILDTFLVSKTMREEMLASYYSDNVFGRQYSEGPGQERPLSADNPSIGIPWSAESASVPLSTCSPTGCASTYPATSAMPSCRSRSFSTRP